MAIESLNNSSKNDMLREKPDGETAPAAEVGWYLQRERETLGHSLMDVANELRVDPHFLHALEQGELHHQLGWTYVLSYVRSYSDFLGFEPSPVVRHYKKILAHEAGERALEGDKENWPFSEVRARAAIATFAGIVGLMGVAGLVFEAEKVTGENEVKPAPAGTASEVFNPSKNKARISEPITNKSQQPALPAHNSTLREISSKTIVLVEMSGFDNLPEVSIRETSLYAQSEAEMKSRAVQKRLHELSNARLAAVSEN